MVWAASLLPSTGNDGGDLGHIGGGDSESWFGYAINGGQVARC